MDVRPAPRRARRACASTSSRLRPARRAEGPGARRRARPTACRTRSSPTSSGCSRCCKNLLSNALKFTEVGSVRLSVHPAAGRHAASASPTLDDGREPVIAFSVTDTGIGVPAEKLEHIFEAFQQADGTTSRKYGGTGLGLSISRGDRATARRRHRGGERGRRRARRSRSTCRRRSRSASRADACRRSRASTEPGRPAPGADHHG